MGQGRGGDGGHHANPATHPHSPGARASGGGWGREAGVAATRRRARVPRVGRAGARSRRPQQPLRVTATTYAYTGMSAAVAHRAVRRAGQMKDRSDDTAEYMAHGLGKLANCGRGRGRRRERGGGRGGARRRRRERGGGRGRGGVQSSEIVAMRAHVCVHACMCGGTEGVPGDAIQPNQCTHTPAPQARRDKCAHPPPCARTPCHHTHTHSTAQPHAPNHNHTHNGSHSSADREGTTKGRRTARLWCTQTRPCTAPGRLSAPRPRPRGPATRSLPPPPLLRRCSVGRR